MEPTLCPRVKICCMGSVHEARLAIRFGASAVGLVSAMPSGPGVIADDLIARIAAIIPPGVASVLLTSQVSAEAIIAQQRHARVNTLQIVDYVEPSVYGALRAALPGVALIQVIHVGGEESFQEATAAAPLVDALLLDSGNQRLAVKELGGTGRVHDWSISRRIREAVGVPLFLAGGLSPDNAAAAIAAVAPYGLDVCSGVRTDGHLDEDKLARFFAAVRAVRAAL